MSPFIKRFAVSLFVLSGIPAVTTRGADMPDAKVEAPTNTMPISQGQGGAYFVARPLKEEYDKLITRVQSLEADLSADRVDGSLVLHELNDLKPRLDQLREEINQKRVFVSPFQTHVQDEEISFDLGPDRLLAISGARVKVEGWKGTQVKCVLKKIVYSTNDLPVQDALRGIKLVHLRGQSSDVLNQPAIDYKNDDLTPFSPFMGKVTDTVFIQGLHTGGPDKNQMLFVRINSPGGGSYGQSDVQRHAELTVYVPECKVLALRNCSESLDVQGVHGALLLVGRGGADGPSSAMLRSWDAPSIVRGLSGSLVCDGLVPHNIDDIQGNVTITARLGSTSEFLGEPMTASGDRGILRKVYTDAPQAMTCRNISGDLTARLLQTNLNLDGIGGKMDVLNDFGSTNWSIAAPLAEKAHRVVSQSGRIEVKFNTKALAGLPVEALSNCGFVRFESSRANDVFKSAMASLGSDFGAARDWRGLESPRKNESEVATAERLKSILEGKDRSPGLDLISHCGSVLLHYEN